MTLAIRYCVPWVSSIARKSRTTTPTARGRLRRRRAPGDGQPVSRPQHRAPLAAHHCRYADTAFKQQRLKAWQPILTPKTVLPTLFIIGIIFAPIGGLLVWGSSLVSEITLDYSDCEKLPPSPAASPNFVEMPSNKFSYRLRSADEKAKPTIPKYAFIDNTGNTSVGVSNEQQCIVEFDIPAELNGPVLFYYKLTNFFQNHRRYVKSLNTDQLKGKAVSASDLQNSDCKPLAQININGTNLPVYPCGLIANSVFNGTSDLFPTSTFIIISSTARHVRQPDPY